MSSPELQTLPELLIARAHAGAIHFLDYDGNISSSITHSDLVVEAQKIAAALLSTGLRGGGQDIVVSNFEDQRKHILLFWACSFAGIPISPTPPFHPDPSRQTLLLEHLQDLFHKPTFVSDAANLAIIDELLPGAKLLEFSSLLTTSSLPPYPNVYPSRKANSSDTVALMLTSGSTGNSKGVVLTHAKLLAAVKGKTSTHKTAPNHVFLNWINFDHVANVTEIHLHALYGGASQYQVSPSAIIRRPRNLLDWCSKYRVTNSFSPNFLIAQILRDVPATTKDIDLTALRVFITGGEANPVKTAVEFADLLEEFGAPRTTLRAAFGMTETGAGSIYNLHPIPKSTTESAHAYLSIGSPTESLLMRTVNPVTSIPNTAGDAGHLQVSGPCVFTEYYRNPTVTTSSFTEDGWFTTGDLAVVDTDGMLHMVGREKDDINVNGVKHPSVDIEHYVEDSNIPGVEASFVLVSAMRVDANDATETYGVFYRHSSVHVEPIDAGEPLTPEQVKEVLKTNRAIKNICAIFCSQAPHTLLPLPRSYFTKTALGKVSRAALAKAYIAGKFAAIEAYLRFEGERQDQIALSGRGIVDPSTRSAFDSILCEGIAHVFDLDPLTIDLQQNLFDIGASSMHLIRLKQFLQDRFHLPDIPTIQVLKRPIIADLGAYVQLLVDAKNSDSGELILPYNPLVCFTPAGSKSPLYLIHPGVGEVLIFINIARVLNDDRPVFALRARGFEAGETPPQTMQEMVDIYTDAIQANDDARGGKGEFYIAGYSFGGAVAVEISKKLEARGKKVVWVGVMNLPPFIQFRIKELVWVETMLNLSMFLQLILSEDFDDFKGRLLDAYPDGAKDREPDCAVDIIKWVFANCDQARLKELDMPLDVFHRWIRVAYDVSYTGRDYLPSGAVVGALTTVFCAIPLPSMGTRQEYKRDRLSKWRDYSGEHFEMVDVDGEHYTMISEEHVESFAVKMRDAIHRAVALHQPVPSPAPALAPKANFDAIPIVDFSLASKNPSKYFSQLKFALEDVGFGVFINVPGFDPAFQQVVFDQQAKFFAKTQEWKDQLGTEHSESLRGYFRSDTVEPPHKAYAEAFRFGAERPSHSDPETPFWLRIHEGPNQWPTDSDMPGFRYTIETLLSRYHNLNLELNKHVAHLLGVSQETVDDFYPEKLEFNSVLWHYLPITPELKKSATNGFVNGMHEHRDPSTFLTCLIQSRPGLQVQNHTGEWIDIPMVEGGVICNVGMQLMRLTGGKFVATTHRVNTLKIDEDRYTIPYVLTTTLSKPVFPLPQFAATATDPIAKAHVLPNKKVIALMSVQDPSVRSGYARLSLFPGAAKKMYPAEWEEAKALGIV